MEIFDLTTCRFIPSRQSMSNTIKIALIRNERTLQDIADHIGCSRPLISMILTGKHKGYTYRPIIARLLGLSDYALAQAIKQRRPRAPRPAGPTATPRGAARVPAPSAALSDTQRRTP